MSTEVKKTAVLKGGEWLIKESSPFETFIPALLNNLFSFHTVKLSSLPNAYFPRIFKTSFAN